MRVRRPSRAWLLAALFIILAGCAETAPPDDDDDTTEPGDDDTGDDDTGDDDSAGDDDTGDDDTGDDDTGDDDTGDDDDSTDPPVGVRTPATHQLCAAAGKTSGGGITMTACFGPSGLGLGTTTDGTITLHAGALRQIAP
jgi:hypothetical protein